MKIVNSRDMGSETHISIDGECTLLDIKDKKWRCADNKGNLSPDIRSLHTVKQHGTGKLERIPFNKMLKYWFSSHGCCSNVTTHKTARPTGNKMGLN